MQPYSRASIRPRAPRVIQCFMLKHVGARISCGRQDVPTRTPESQHCGVCCCLPLSVCVAQARLLCRLAEVAQGMAYLHTKQIIHGDLKAANVLLVNSIHGSFGQIAKLTDFGLAGVLRDGITHHSTQNLGTVSHCAPEVLAAGHVSPAADVYAFGIMSKLLSCSLYA